MKDKAVSPLAYNQRLRDQFKIRPVHNYYGMAEQTGSIYVACEYGHLHASVFSDVIMRRPLDFMPTMWCYSWLISLLAGNSNIVRISPRLVPQVQPICQLIDCFLQGERFQPLREQNCIVSYGQDAAVTDVYSTMCDVRLLWSGDASIMAIRQSPLPPTSLELTFADRYSLALFDTQMIAAMAEDELREWAHCFYNDTYEADQNACSSPHLIVWLGNHTSLEEVQHRWWQAVFAETQAYDLAPIKVSTKYTQLWHVAMTMTELQTCKTYGNALYVYTLSTLPPDITALSGSFGQYFQLALPTIEPLLLKLTKKIQTITTIGVDATVLRHQLQDYHICGVDRIVPVGQALTMDVIWDGTNLLEFLSRYLH